MLLKNHICNLSPQKFYHYCCWPALTPEFRIFSNLLHNIFMCLKLPTSTSSGSRWPLRPVQLVNAHHSYVGAVIGPCTSIQVTIIVHYRRGQNGIRRICEKFNSPIFLKYWYCYIFLNNLYCTTGNVPFRCIHSFLLFISTVLWIYGYSVAK